MKKVILAVAVIAMIGGFASCKKTSKCQCTYKFEGVEITMDPAEYAVSNCSKLDAKTLLIQDAVSDLNCKAVK